MRVVLVNPNTNGETTRVMLQIARECAGPNVMLEALTAGFGAPLICDEASLQTAAEAVGMLVPALRQARPDGVIVAAFGDPGRQHLASALACPVVGIAQAGMAEAAVGGRCFSVVTTTPDLAAAIIDTAARYGFQGQCLGVRVTPGDPRLLMADPDALERAMLHACELAVYDDKAEAIVIGGGPLATVARALAGRLPVPVIESIPAALRMLAALWQVPDQRPVDQSIGAPARRS